MIVIALTAESGYCQEYALQQQRSDRHVPLNEDANYAAQGGPDAISCADIAQRLKHGSTYASYTGCRSPRLPVKRAGRPMAGQPLDVVIATAVPGPPMAALLAVSRACIGICSTLPMPTVIARWTPSWTPINARTL